MSLQDYLELIKNKENKIFFEKLISWVEDTFPELELKIKWNQPMFVLDGTFIISFNPSNEYISSSIEKVFLKEFRSELEASDFDTKNMVFHIEYNRNINYGLLEKIIRRIIEYKRGLKRFWI